MNLFGYRAAPSGGWVGHVDAWGDCVCRPATFKVPRPDGRYDYLYGCTCPTGVGHE